LVPASDLLSGAALEISASAPLPISRDEVFGLDAQMRAFVAANGGGATRFAKLQKLLSAMTARGLFSLAYATDETRTASAAFHEHRGNCLSFTMLFVALAREAGLTVSYQSVEVPPTWSAHEDLVVIGSHVNALIKTPLQSNYVVDFNAAGFETQYAQREIDDDHVLALFYSNLGAEALLRKQYESSFVYLKAALAARPDIPGPWVNLGILYLRHGLPAYAEAAYFKALDADSRDGSALTNLVSLYTKLGERERAARYADRARRYQQRNPYYHFTLAKAAYEQERLEDALKAVRRAIRLKADEHRFYSLRGLVYTGLGEQSSAQASFERARDYGASSARTPYDVELEALTEASEVPRSMRLRDDQKLQTMPTEGTSGR
jgi:tetratricopeptide (TPR) repeat protein